ncbi:MAG: DUF1858 domain-containing protein [Clostridia bacterium]|nr:DUF1858 domain-containing protein [Clostridia bacterium]
MITKETNIGEILEIKPEAAEVLMEMGMHCLGCPASRAESLEDACAVHDVDVDEILDKINAL